MARLLLLFLLFCLLDAAVVSASTRTLLPKPGRLSPELYVCDLQGASMDESLFCKSIQGIVNQTRPRLYVILDPENDLFWLDWIRQRGYVRSVTRIDRADLVKAFRSELNGAVVYDPAFHASVNIATMIAGVNRFAIIAPDMIEKCGLPIKSDLRGRFSDNAAAYEWAIERLWPKLNHRVLCSLMPTAAGHWLRDYLIQNKVFTFWVTGPNDARRDGASDRERGVIERVFRLTPPNTPIIGFWYAGEQFQGISEYGGLVWAGGFGKPTICHDWSTNSSIQSAIRVDPMVFRQKPVRARKFQRDKVYVAVNIIESGDAPWYWARCQPKVWRDANRGKVPISWCVGPATLDISPAILEWYYRNLAPTDCFFTAVSGAAYMMPIYFAKKTAHPDAVWKDFFALTDLYMRRLDHDIVSLHMDAWGVSPPHYEDSAIFRAYADNLPRLRSILADFGRMENLDLNRANHRTSRNVTVFHCLNRWDITGDPGEWLACEIRRWTPAARPGFMHVMALSWTFTPSHIVKAREIVGDSYEFVNARELDQLFRLAGSSP